MNWIINIITLSIYNDSYRSYQIHNTILSNLRFSKNLHLRIDPLINNYLRSKYLLLQI